MSEAIKLLDLVWGNANRATGFSYERLNHSMRDALRLTIGSGFAFELGDMKYIAEHYRFGYWCGSCIEWIYSLAVAVENMSVVKSFEAWKGRTPFMFDGVSIQSNNGFTHGSRMTRQRERLVVGADCEWRGYSVTVTSFAQDQKSLTACSYRRMQNGGYSGQVEERFTITHDAIKVERAERKERENLLDVLTSVATDQTRGDIIKALGLQKRPEHTKRPVRAIRLEGAPPPQVETMPNWQQQFARLPITKIRKVAARYAPA